MREATHCCECLQRGPEAVPGAMVVPGSARPGVCGASSAQDFAASSGLFCRRQRQKVSVYNCR